MIKRTCALTLLALWFSVSHAEPMAGTIVDIADGDTLAVFSKGVIHRVRLAGVRAPKNGQPYEARSRENLVKIAHRKDATLECFGVGRDQHEICKVQVRPLSCPACGHTLDVSLAQIVSGAAWWDRKYASEQSTQDRGRYESEETEARLRHRGLWSLPNPIPPWEWRARSP